MLEDLCSEPGIKLNNSNVDLSGRAVSRHFLVAENLSILKNNWLSKKFRYAELLCFLTGMGKKVWTCKVVIVSNATAVNVDVRFLMFGRSFGNQRRDREKFWCIASIQTFLLVLLKW